MDFVHIPLENLKVSALNMRAGRKKPPFDDILPSIGTRGVLVPLLVRPKDRDDAFEIIAGRRRYFASKVVARESGETKPLPCRVLSECDDAAAIEASILENVARLEPDKQQTRKEATAQSLAASKGEAIFAKERQAIAALFELEDAVSISGGNGDEYRLTNLFVRLMKLSDEDVTRILVFVAGELMARDTPPSTASSL